MFLTATLGRKPGQVVSARQTMPPSQSSGYSGYTLPPLPQEEEYCRENVMSPNGSSSTASSQGEFNLLAIGIDWILIELLYIISSKLNSTTPTQTWSQSPKFHEEIQWFFQYKPSWFWSQAKDDHFCISHWRQSEGSCLLWWRNNHAIMRNELTHGPWC